MLVLSPGYTHTGFKESSGAISNPLAGWKQPEEVVEKGFKKNGQKPKPAEGLEGKAFAPDSGLNVPNGNHQAIIPEALWCGIDRREVLL